MPEPSRDVLVPQPFSWAIDAVLGYVAYRLAIYAWNRQPGVRTVGTIEIIQGPGAAPAASRSVPPGPVERVPAALGQLAQAVEAQIAANISRAPTVVQTAPSSPTLLPPQPGNPAQAFGPRAVGLTPGGAPTVLAGGPTQVIVPPATPQAVGGAAPTQLAPGGATRLVPPARPTVLGPTPPAPPPVDLGEGMGFPGGGGGRLATAGRLAGGAAAAVQAGVTLYQLARPGATMELLVPSVPPGTPGGGFAGFLFDLARPFAASVPSPFAPAPAAPIMGQIGASAPAPSPGGLGAFGFALPGAAGGADWTAAPPAPAFALPGPFPASPPRPAFALFPPGAGLFSQGGPAGAGTGAVGGQPGRVVLPPGLTR